MAATAESPGPGRHGHLLPVARLAHALRRRQDPGAALLQVVGAGVVSGHWETATPAVNIIRGSNDTIHDFYGFPKPMAPGRLDASLSLSRAKPLTVQLIPTKVQQKN